MPDEHWIFAPLPENEFRQMQDFGPILCSISSLFNNLYNFSGKYSGSPGPNSKQRRTEDEESKPRSGRPGAGDPGPAGPLSRSHGPHRLPQSLPHRHPHLAVSAAERAGALREHRQADPLLQDRQSGRGRLPAPSASPSRRTTPRPAAGTRTTRTTSPRPSA